VNRRNRPVSVSFAGYRFPPGAILLAVRWYLRYGLSYRDVAELLAERRIENDHDRLKARLRPMRGLRTDQTASVVIRGHAFMQNLRRGHYELGVEARHERLRVAAAFDELAQAI